MKKMNDLTKTAQLISSGALDARFARLYGDIPAARARFLHLTDFLDVIIFMIQTPF